MKILNILIVDDNPIVGKNIMQRMIALDEEAIKHKSRKPRLNVNYIDGQKHKYYDYSTNPDLIREVEINLLNADYLLSDIYIQDINIEKTFELSTKDILINIDEKADNVDFQGLTPSAKEYLQKFSKQSSDIYKQIQVSAIEKISKKLKNIIVYTYSPNAKSNELPEKARNINEALRIDSNKTEVFSSHQALYQSSDFDLYKTWKVNTNLASIGLKCDYGLYGAALGEILYHKIMDKEADYFNEKIEKTKSLYFQRIILFFLIALSIDFGGNALFDVLKENNVSSTTVLIISLCMGLFIPLLVLFLKPSLLVSFDENEDEQK
jgi:hypothetical protein